MKNSNRQTKREIQKKKQTQKNLLTFGGLGLLVLAVVVVIVLSSNKSPATASGLMGTAVPITSAQHVPDGTQINYNSNPPAGGLHYETPLKAGFYQEGDLATLPKNPEGHLVHSLEHGYVIFWYNCEVATDCAALKQTIQGVMAETGGTKLIAFPWSKMDVPLAMTSWGQVLRFTGPDAEQMKEFVQRNRYQAPEPHAD